jgi:hypothetical protein
MDVEIYRLGYVVFAVGTIWDIFTSITGIGSSVGGFAVTGNILQIIVDLIFKNTLGTLTGLLFAGFVIFLDHYLLKASTEWYNFQDKPLTWIILFIWLPFKWVDFSTTVVGTAKFFPLKISENAEFGDVWSTVTGHSWNQMIILLLLSVAITSSSIGFIICQDKIREAQGK